MRRKLGGDRKHRPLIVVTGDPTGSTGATCGDVRAFREALAAAQNADDPVPHLKEAVELYQGDYCKDAYFGSTEDLRYKLERAYIDAVLKLSDTLIERGATEEAHAIVDRALAIDPYSDALARRAKGLDARPVGRAAALERFRRFRAALREIGVEPEPETLSLVTASGSNGPAQCARCQRVATHDGLTVVIAGWPFAEFSAYRNNIEGNFLKTLELAPPSPIVLAAPRAKHASSARRYRTSSASPMGCTTRFRDAELCATALHETFSGARSFEAAMAEYQTARDTHVLPFYEFTTQIATLEPPPPELGRLLGAVAGKQKAIDQFFRVTGGVTSPSGVFFRGEHRTRVRRR